MRNGKNSFDALSEIASQLVGLQEHSPRPQEDKVWGDFLSTLKVFLKKLEQSASAFNAEKINEYLNGYSKMSQEMIDHLNTSQMSPQRKESLRSLSQSIIATLAEAKNASAKLLDLTNTVERWLGRFDPDYHGSNNAPPAYTALVLAFHNQRPPAGESNMRVNFIDPVNLKPVIPEPEIPSVRLRTVEATQKYINENLSQDLRSIVEQALDAFYQQHQNELVNQHGSTEFKAANAFYNHKWNPNTNQSEAQFFLVIDGKEKQKNSSLYQHLLNLTVNRATVPITTSRVFQKSGNWQEQCKYTYKKEACAIPLDSVPEGAIIVFGSFISKLLTLFPRIPERAKSPIQIQSHSASQESPKAPVRSHSGLFDASPRESQAPLQASRAFPSEPSAQREPQAPSAFIDPQLEENPEIKVLLEQIAAEEREQDRLAAQEAAARNQLKAAQEAKIKEHIAALEAILVQRRAENNKRRQTIMNLDTEVSSIQAHSPALFRQKRERDHEGDPNPVENKRHEPQP